MVWRQVNINALANATLLLQCHWCLPPFFHIFNRCKSLPSIGRHIHRPFTIIQSWEFWITTHPSLTAHKNRKWWAGECGHRCDRSELHKSFLSQLWLSDFLHFPWWSLNKHKYFYIFSECFPLNKMQMHTKIILRLKQSFIPVFHLLFPFQFFHLTLIFGCPNHTNMGWRAHSPKVSFSLCKDSNITLDLLLMGHFVVGLASLQEQLICI